MLYFSLEAPKGQLFEKYSLRGLAQHFLNNNEDAYPFEEYRQKMSAVFTQTRDRLLQQLWYVVRQLYELYDYDINIET